MNEELAQRIVNYIEVLKENESKLHEIKKNTDDSSYADGLEGAISITKSVIRNLQSEIIKSHCEIKQKE